MAIKKEQVDEVFRMISTGASVSDACAVAGMSRETFYQKAKTIPEFKERWERSEARCRIANVQRIQLAASRGTWQASAWWLERKYPEEYAERFRHQADIKFANTLLALVSRALQKNLPETCPHCRTNLDLPEKVSQELMGLSRRLSEETA